MKIPHKIQLSLVIFETATSGHLLQNACQRNVMKLRYKVIKEKYVKKIVLIFSVRKSQNSNKEEKNSITLPSSHLEAIL